MLTELTIYTVEVGSTFLAAIAMKEVTTPTSALIFNYLPMQSSSELVHIDNSYLPPANRVFSSFYTLLLSRPIIL